MPIDRRSLLTYAAALPLSTWKLVFSSIVPREHCRRRRVARFQGRSFQVTATSGLISFYG